jgi:nucleoside-diphosphate-sugar epimerase
VKYLVTGGGGFLGLAIVRALRARGDEVVSYSRTRHAAVEALGARCVQGDLLDAAALRRAMDGCDGVFHVAAKAGVWGARAEYARTNIDGTACVVDSSLASGVPRLVHTSSPSACFDGRGHLRASNDLPLAASFQAHYPWSKARAERTALEADGARLSVVALRPHLIFGRGDPHLLPRVAARARAGRLVAVGDRSNRVSLCHVTNAAHAHLAAMDALKPGAACAGKAYFVAQEEDVRLWDWLDSLCDALGWRRSRGPLPLPLARALGAGCEAAWWLARLPGEPPLTRFTASQLALSHSYDMEPARRDFGYAEQVDLAAATREAIAWLRELQATRA